MPRAEPAPIRIARERHGLVGDGRQGQDAGLRAVEDAGPVLAAPTSPGRLPLLVLVLAGLFAGLFVGDLLSTLLSGAWSLGVARDPCRDRPRPRQGVRVSVGLGVTRAGTPRSRSASLRPHVLSDPVGARDTGYLNAVVFLTDPFMHKLGLHGRAVIPLVAGAGCNVPAILGTRVLATTRERILASTLVCLVPCSARTAVIAGAVYKYVGWEAAVGIYLIVAALGWGAGWGLNRVLPGRSTGLVMEMFPFRAPCLRTMLKRTWYRFKGFVWVAMPVVLAGSLALGIIYETGLVWALTVPLRPIVEGWLGLPRWPPHPDLRRAAGAGAPAPAHARDRAVQRGALTCSSSWTAQIFTALARSSGIATVAVLARESWRARS